MYKYFLFVLDRQYLKFIFFYIFIKQQQSILPAFGDEQWMRDELEEETIGDEITSDTNSEMDFESVVNEIAQEKNGPDQRKCGFCSKLPPIAGESVHPNIDPEIFIKVLFNVMGVLEKKVTEAMHVSESGVCVQIKPIDIFLKKNPYENYDEVLSKSDALEALEKMKTLKAEVRSKIPGI